MKKHVSDLGDLVNPTKYVDPLDLGNYSHKDITIFLESMLTIRFVEEAIADLILSGEAKCPCHLGIGQEAIAVGVAKSLRTSDRVFGTHRSHAHFLSMGGTPASMLAEVLGKLDGCSRGMGGSMHLYGQEFGFYGSVPIVGGIIPLAVGAALAAKMDNCGDIAVAYFGDGTSEEGVLHESLNLASQYELPILFVCENNLYASHLDIAQRQPSDSIARFADAHRIQSEVVDGNDVITVCDVAGKFIENMRNSGGPAFLEAITYRWRGHVGPDENIDVGVRRKASDIAAWKQRDPVKRLYEGMKATYNYNLTRSLNEVEDDIKAKVLVAVEFARAAPYPKDSFNSLVVYFDGDSA